MCMTGREFSDMFVDWFEEGSSRGKHPLVCNYTHPYVFG
jgi:hypothetical protein